MKGLTSLMNWEGRISMGARSGIVGFPWVLELGSMVSHGCYNWEGSIPMGARKGTVGFLWVLELEM